MMTRSRRRPARWAVPLAALVFAGLPAHAQTADDAVGVWQHTENASQIELYKCGGALCGRIAKVGDNQTTDLNNPDPSKRGRPVVGLVILEEAQQSGPATWAGALYNRSDGRHYDGRLTVTGKDRLELTGCTAVIICRTVVWRRIR